MAYLTIKQIKEQYNIADKTIRRLYENKTISRSQGYKNKKGKWVLSSDFIESRFADKRKDQHTEQAETEPKTKRTSQTNSQDQVLMKTIELLQAQLEAKDRQIDNLTQLTDQQQKLTAQLQTQLLISSPTEPITDTKQAETPNPQTQPKKAVRKPIRKPQGNKKATKPKKKSWWRRG